MFKFKSPSLKTRKLMSEVALGKYSDVNFEKKCEDKIRKLTSHNHVKITSSGNNSIFIALSSIEGDVIIPDQGGWHGFKQIGKFLNKNIITLKTDSGIINPEILDDLEVKSNSALIFTSFAGYCAEQNTKKISKYCKKNEIISIEDASAGIGDSENKLGNGNFSDIIIASTGSPKIINVGSGGFISSNDSKVFDNTGITQKLSKTNEIICSGIYEELNNVEENLKDTLNATNYLKKHIETPIHREKRGVNVIIPHDKPGEKIWNLKKTLPINKSGFLTKCPNYNRIKQKAISIEIKNLEISCLTKDNLDKIIDEINSNNQQ